jgi:uncharacterized protein (TIGR00251 family)
MPFARWDNSDLILELHIQPGARRTEVAGLHGDALKLRLAARPVEGAANEALLDFLSNAFAVSRRDLALLSGAQSRKKRVRVTGPERVLADELLKTWTR